MPLLVVTRLLLLRPFGCGLGQDENTRCDPYTVGLSVDFSTCYILHVSYIAISQPSNSNIQSHAIHVCVVMYYIVLVIKVLNKNKFN